MSSVGKPRASELQRIEDALVDSLLAVTGDDLRIEITEAGGDPVAVIARVDAAIRSAQADSGRRHLDQARGELADWRARGGATESEREAARNRLEKLRSGWIDPETPMTMAARKGEGLSESDEQGLVEDIAELERLERDTGKG
jgi:uncharacterized protein (DUF58 family)